MLSQPRIHRCFYKDLEAEHQHFWRGRAESWQPVCMSSTFTPRTRPIQAMEIRVIERGGKRVLQQYLPPSGGASQWSWVNISELASLPTPIRHLMKRTDD